MRNRVYDSGLGRFTSVDPLNVLGGDVDLYTFAENAPVEYVDPTGMAPFPSLTTPAPAFPSSLLGLGEKAGMGYALSTSVASNGLVKAFSGGPAALGLGLANTAGLNYAKDYYGWTEANSSFKNQALDLSITGLGFVPQTALPLASFYAGTFVGAQIRKIPDVDTRYQMTFTFFFPGWSQPDDQLSDAAKQRLQNGFTNPYKKNVSVPTSHDPNEITGPAAYGSQGFIPANDSLPYRIDFTNQATATAPAQTVVVTQQLSTNLDLSTFQLGDIGFGSTVISVPAGQTSYSTRVTLPSAAPAGTGPDGLYVDISASLNMQTGLVTWTFTSIDPTTLDVPMNPLEGFLPPDENEPEGEGYVSYTVSPKSSVTTGAVINAQATVVFDQMRRSPLHRSQIRSTRPFPRVRSMSCQRPPAGRLHRFVVRI